MSSLRLTSRPRGGSGAPRTQRAPTTDPGFTNPNRQQVLRATGAESGSRPGQRVYVLRCTVCGREYGCNGMEIKSRRCPHCQSGAPGEPYSERQEASLFDL